LERDILEKEKSDSYNRLKAELEETKTSLEQRIRVQVEQEMKDKMNKESQLRAELQMEEEQRRKEEEERNRYALQKKDQEIARAKINQEIHQGMERLRLEKEKEIKSPAPAANPIPLGKNAPPGSAGSPEVLEDPFIRQTLADIYSKQGLYVEALKIYERILNDEPNNEDVKEKLRDLLRLKGM
jgi:tetratricopeptide (TPR) repeat protein